MQLNLKDLSKIYQDADRELVVINSLTHQFKSAKSTAILGRSGIGKSTLLNILAGIDLPSSGSVFYDQIELSALSSEQQAKFRATQIGFVFQFHHLLPEFSALENVALPLVIAGNSLEQAKIQAKEILENVGLAARILHRPGELSGGESQRVAIARALVGKPKVVLADEPTGNLDPYVSKDVKDLLLGLCRDYASTLIVVTHSRELAAEMDYAYEMQVGGQLWEVNVK